MLLVTAQEHKIHFSKTLTWYLFTHLKQQNTTVMYKARKSCSFCSLIEYNYDVQTQKKLFFLQFIIPEQTSTAQVTLGKPMGYIEAHTISSQFPPCEPCNGPARSCYGDKMYTAPQKVPRVLSFLFYCQSFSHCSFIPWVMLSSDLNSHREQRLLSYTMSQSTLNTHNSTQHQKKRDAL